MYWIYFVCDTKQIRLNSVIGKDEKELFIDCDYKFFVHILNKLRFPNYEFPASMSETEVNNLNDMWQYFHPATSKKVEKDDVPIFVFINGYYTGEFTNEYEVNTEEFTIISCTLKFQKLVNISIYSRNCSMIHIQKNQLQSIFKLSKESFIMKKKIISYLQQEKKLLIRITGQNVQFDCLCVK